MARPAPPRPEGSPAPPGQDRPGRPGLGLSGKLLLLTIVFVMLAEVLIFVPSIANFRSSWLKDRLLYGQLAALAAEAAPEGVVPEPLREELLMTAQVKAVAMKRKDARMPVLQSDMPAEIAETFDLREASSLRLIVDTLAVFPRRQDRVIRVIGNPGGGATDFVEIVLMERPLRTAMVGYGLTILALSIVISVITAALVYFALNRLLVRPIENMVGNMTRFSRNPEDAGRIITPSDRQDEIGIAERQLADMQRELAHLLHQKTRLAALGLAVSKINHDLRNMLANAQLISDRFQTSKDPMVQRFAPKLIGSLDRAIRLCVETMQFGRAEEEPPRLGHVELYPLVAEVGDGLGLPRPGEIDWQVEMDASLSVRADADQLFRVITNLCRNSVQVLEALPDSGGSVSVQAGHRITVEARRQASAVVIEVRDTGPGVPAKAREHLFEAFKSSARKGGTGLGLAIASEIVRAHGGTLELVDDGGPGACFRMVLPDPEPHG